MPVSKVDPRIYVQQVPLPVSPQKGLKIQARRIDVYNPTVPSRNEVRTNNYIRRMQQMSSQGFKSVSHKPYQGIGDPFFLDEKKLILHALGQWDQSKEVSTSSSSEEGTKEQLEDQLKQKPRMTAAKFVLKRSRKDLNTLNKEVVHGRKMVRNVKLGHGLFDLIKQERIAKKEADVAEYKQRIERARNMWQPPKYDSSSEDDFDDFTDEDLDNMDLSDLDSAVPTPRKKNHVSRPYTPQHTNILESTEAVSKDSLFRQLCVLNWVLEAMAVDNPSVMTRVTSCWKLTDIGGSRYPSKKIQRDKAAEKDWVELLEKRPSGKTSTKGQVAARNPWQKLRVAQAFNQSIKSFGANKMESISDEHKIITTQDSDEDARTKKILEFLSATCKSSYRSDEMDGVAEHTQSTSFHNQTSQDNGKKERQLTDVKSPKNSSRKLNESPEIRPHTSMGQNEEKQSSKMFKADYILRPKSSPSLIEYQAKLPSNKRANLPEEMQKKFAEVKEDKSLSLHDILEQMQRQRYVMCQNKFMVIQQTSRGCSFYRAVHNMRMDSSAMLNMLNEEQLRKGSMKGNWYMQLLDSIPRHLKAEWYYKVIIEKLGKFGLMEGSGKSTVYKFLLVVKSLHSWELCSPDVSAAIEFVREKVVSMTVEDYEEWFQHTFPKITRPETAPPMRKANREASVRGHTRYRPQTTRSAYAHR